MGQGFKPSQQLSYIPILVEVPLPPTPGLPYSKYCAGYAWNAAAFSHTGGGCCKQWSGNSSIQKRAGKWARVNFRKDFWGCYYGTGWGGGGEFGQTAVLATLLLFSNPNFKPFLIYLSGVSPSDSFDEALADMIHDGVYDLRNDLSKGHHEKDEAKKVWFFSLNSIRGAGYSTQKGYVWGASAIRST